MCSATTLHGILSKDEWKLEDVQKLLERDSSSINKRNVHMDTPLHVALTNKNCSADVVKLLLKYGANIKAEGYDRSSPLHVALQHSRDNAVVMILIEKGAYVYALDIYNRSCVCIAFSSRASITVIQALLDAVCLNECRFHGSVLHCAIDQGSVLTSDVLHMLIQRGADLNAVNGIKQSVVCIALMRVNDESTLQLLLKTKGTLNGCLEHASLLLCATARGYVGGDLKASVFQMLLKAGVCPHQVNYEGFTALQCALLRCRYETKAISLLLDCHNGIFLNCVVDKENNSLLHLAVCNKFCKLGSVKLLVQRGIEVDKVNMKGETPLEKAIQNRLCPLSVIKFLLKNGAKVNADRVTSAIVNHNSVEVLKLLLVFSAPISATVFHFILKLEQRLGLSLNQLVCFQYLVRVYFLQVSDYRMSFLNFDGEICQHILSFRNRCVPELLKMKSQNVGRGLTLHDFLSVGGFPYKDAADRKTGEKRFDYDRLLEVIANDAFPLYFEIIADKVGKCSMKAKLQDVRMSAPKYSTMDAPAEQIVLPYDCVLKIVHYLGKEDVLRFILAAFSNVNGSMSNAQVKRLKTR